MIPGTLSNEEAELVRKLRSKAEPQSVSEEAEAALDRLARRYEKDQNVTFAKAYDTVILSKDGRELYAIAKGVTPVHDEVAAIAHIRKMA